MPPISVVPYSCPPSARSSASGDRRRQPFPADRSCRSTGIRFQAPTRRSRWNRRRAAVCAHAAAANAPVKAKAAREPPALIVGLPGALREEICWRIFRRNFLNFVGDLREIETVREIVRARVGRMHRRQSEGFLGELQDAAELVLRVRNVVRSSHTVRSRQAAPGNPARRSCRGAAGRDRTSRPSRPTSQRLP